MVRGRAGAASGILPGDQGAFQPSLSQTLGARSHRGSCAESGSVALGGADIRHF